ncbi:hypothetical protein AXG93_718s1000 [Marchantia polymorpha subsp. ruderalis]|uniref:Uncharacterized protein n=1 Tax=Marchantia polymorpha subsp. ruderalis TaxID=1480154 RepID=A0A176W1G4_MARPO|nr:hypothetical protein AXG93_718s1000 [Marchantia polymorpha subsp. ruderalis]
MTTWQVEFVEQALRGERIHWVRILWYVVHQHIGESPRQSANYLSPFINFYRGMGLLTAAEPKRLPLHTHVVDGAKSLGANEVDTDQEDIQLALTLRRVDGCKDGVEGRLQKSLISEKDVSKEAEEKEAEIEVETPKRNPKPSAMPIVYTQLGMKSLEVVPLLRYLDRKLEKYVRPSVVGSYVELVEKKKLWKSAKKTCERLQGDIETTMRATVDLRDRLKAFRVAFNEESRHVDELTVDLVKRDQTHAVELGAKTKDLA